MSQSSRSFVVAYTLLVGLPLLGLAGVLRSGRTLNAPISVSGVWKIESAGSPVSSQPCDKVLTSFLNTSVAVAQSGKSVMLSFDNAAKTIASGALDGKTLRVALVPARDPLAQTSCPGERSFTLIATVELKTEPRSLHGRLAVDGCESCVPAEFRAVMQPRATGAEAH